jgi:ELWxxDGT repeat protein
MAGDHIHGWEVWRSDGTAAGTTVVSDEIRPGPESSDPRSLGNAAGTLYFTANDGAHGYELWKAVP